MDGNFDVVLSKRFMRKMFWVHLRKSKQHAMSFGPHIGPKPLEKYRISLKQHRRKGVIIK